MVTKTQLLELATGNYIYIYIYIYIYMRFVWFIAIFEKSNRAISKARRPDIEEITPHLLAGTILPGKCIRKSSSGIRVGHVAVDEAKICKA